jgi:hypothetical protein
MTTLDIWVFDWNKYIDKVHDVRFDTLFRFRKEAYLFVRETTEQRVLEQWYRGDLTPVRPEHVPPIYRAFMLILE